MCKQLSLIRCSYCNNHVEHDMYTKWEDKKGVVKYSCDSQVCYDLAYWESFFINGWRTKLEVVV